MNLRLCRLRELLPPIVRGCRHLVDVLLSQAFQCLFRPIRRSWRLEYNRNALVSSAIGWFRVLVHHANKR